MPPCQWPLPPLSVNGFVLSLTCCYCCHYFEHNVENSQPWRSIPQLSSFDDTCNRLLQQNKINVVPSSVDRRNLSSGITLFAVPSKERLLFANDEGIYLAKTIVSSMTFVSTFGNTRFFSTHHFHMYHNTFVRIVHGYSGTHHRQISLSPG